MTRAEDLYQRATGVEPRGPRCFEGLDRRIACHLGRAQILDDQTLLDRVNTGQIRQVRGVGSASIKQICEYLAEKFPFDPAEATP